MSNTILLPDDVAQALKQLPNPDEFFSFPSATWERGNFILTATRSRRHSRVPLGNEGKIMDINLVLTILFGLIGAAGVGASVYYGKKSSALQRAKISLDFEDLSAAIADIANFIKSDRFYPDIIYTPGAKSAILAELLSQKFTHEPLVIVGSLEWKDSALCEINPTKSAVVESNKWRIYIPNHLIENSDKKLLIVDDITMSGDGLHEIISTLINAGFEKSNIKSSTLVCTSVAIASKKAPEYYWKKTEGTTFYFPWGKTR